MYGQKQFVNNTPDFLSVQITPRIGDTPGNEGPPVNFSLAPGQSADPIYGNDQNPFVDGISVNIVENGNITATQEFVLTRGSTVDNDFNMNGTVIFNLVGNSIVMAFSNN